MALLEAGTGIPTGLNDASGGITSRRSPFTRGHAKREYRNEVCAMLAIRFARSDKSKRNERELLMEAHKAHLRSGRIEIIQSGPLLDHDAEQSSWGALIVADVPDLRTLERFSDEDPFVMAGVYVDVVIREWRKSIG